MDSDLWKLAGLQYLEHLERLGIRHLPRPHANLPELLVDWGPGDRGPGDRAIVDRGPGDRAIVDRGQTAAKAVPSAPTTKIAQEAPTPVAPAPRKPTGPPVESPWSTPPKAADERTAALGELKLQVEACRLCSDLACRRQQTVFGVGPVTTRFVMIGEAPGAEEDRLGEPFVGPAGQLLDKILLATGIPRDQVYILNALKCRPPNNRVPNEIELENCRPFFEAQLEILQPDYIICWGATAVRSVLNTTESIGQLRGRFHWYKKAKVIVTYHPSYLLRAPEAKRLTWDDMQMLMRELGTLKA